MGKGKENSSGKEKKLARAAALAAEKERKQHIAQAAAITTPLSAFEPMVKAAQAKFGVDVVHAASASLSEADHDFCFALLKRNMESLRLDAGWGFNDSGERATLRDEESHFLILRPSGQEDAAASPAGFCMYRWILEGECTVLYVYELQLTAGAGHLRETSDHAPRLPAPTGPPIAPYRTHLPLDARSSSGPQSTAARGSASL